MGGMYDYIDRTDPDEGREPLEFGPNEPAVVALLDAFCNATADELLRFHDVTWALRRSASAYRRNAHEVSEMVLADTFRDWCRIQDLIDANTIVTAKLDAETEALREQGRTADIGKMDTVFWDFEHLLEATIIGDVVGTRPDWLQPHHVRDLSEAWNVAIAGYDPLVCRLVLDGRRLREARQAARLLR